MVAIGFVLGDGLGNLGVWIPLWAGILASLGAALLYLAARPHAARWLALVGITLAATIPAFRLYSPLPDPSSIANFPDRSMVTLIGVIRRAPERFPGRTHLFVDVGAAGTPPHPLRPASGMVRVTILMPNHFRVGDEVRVAGRIRFPYRLGDPSEFNYQAWLQRSGVNATLTIPPNPRYGVGIKLIGYQPIFPASLVETIRDRIRRFIDANAAYPESAELKALLIGDRSGIDNNLRDEFARTGMAHLLVISGLHLGLVAAAAFALARFILGFFTILLQRGYANKIAASFAALAVIGYASIAGHHVSTTRALVMVLTYMLAIIIDRGRDVIASLAFAAIVICLMFPGSSADIGFELTFASVLAIVLGMRRFVHWWRRRVRPAVKTNRAPLPYAFAAAIVGYFAVSFWALLGTAPLTARYFNQFSTVGLIANAVVVPIAGFGGAVVGLAAAATSFFLPVAAVFLLHIAAFFLQIGTWLTGWFNRWPLSWVRIFTPTVLEIAITYAVLMLWLTLPLNDSRCVVQLSDRRSGRNRRWRLMALAALIILTFADCGWWTYQRYFNPDLRVTFLSVGEGDAAVVRFPGSRVMVIDSGGSYGSGYNLGERIVAPFLWSHKILHVNYLALSHPDLDHFGGFQFIAQNFGPGEFWTSVDPSPDQRYLALLIALAKERMELRLMNSDSPPVKIGGVTIKCAGPPPDEHGTRNDNSMVLRLAYGRTSFLFTGDIEAAGERAITSSGADVRATILKVPHHGSRTSSTADFIEAVAPRVAVISLGYMNHYHFPAEVVLNRYRRFDAKILRTDLDGAITVNAGQDAFHVSTWRQGEVKLRAGGDMRERAASIK